jgi:hypothetical protein
VSEAFDVLIHKHLEGTLSEDEAKIFHERLKANPEHRKRLAEMAFEHAQLKELLEPAAKPAFRMPRWIHAAAAAAILLAVGVAIFRGTPKPVEVEEERKPVVAKKREGYEGFRGRVFARVLERKDKQRVYLKVVEVLAVRDASEAGQPARLVGETIGVLPPRFRDGEVPLPADKDRAAYLTKLLPGQEVVLELRHVEAGDFAIESLTEEQVEWARRDKRPAKETPKKPVEREDGK